MIVSVIAWMVLGLVAVLLAKFILPGRDPGRSVATTLIGVAGAVLGGFTGRRFDLAAPAESLSAPALATAVVGALILLAIYRVARQGPRKPS